MGHEVKNKNKFNIFTLVLRGKSILSWFRKEGQLTFEYFYSFLARIEFLFFLNVPSSRLSLKTLHFLPPTCFNQLLNFGLRSLFFPFIIMKIYTKLCALNPCCLSSRDKLTSGNLERNILAPS